MRRHRAERAEQYESATYKLLVSSVAANVRALRKKTAWTQEIAAEKCGMLVQVFQRIEAGGGNLTLTTLARLCDGFEVAAVRLLKARRAPSQRSPGRPRTAPKPREPSSKR